jgi:hypothetical protein
MNRVMAYLPIFILVLASSAHAEEIWISQSGGTACGHSTNSASWFNSSGNWGSGTGQINGGDTVYFCGTITSSLTMQGSGTNDSSRITFEWSGATMAGRFDGSYRNYYNINNMTTTFSSEKFLKLQGASYVTVSGLAHNAVAQNGVDVGYAHHILFTGWNVTTTNDYLPSTERDLIAGCPHDMTIEKSYIHKRWNSQSGTSAHNDIWQWWGTASDSSCPNPYNIVLRYSFIRTDVDYDGNFQFLMWAHGSGTNSIYGNVFLKTGSNGSGSVIAIESFSSGSVTNIYNNTFISKDTPCYFLINIPTPQSNATVNFRNNIAYTTSSSGSVIYSGGGNFIHQYNTYNGGSSTSYLRTNCVNYASTGELCDKNPMFTDYAGNEFSLQIGSDANGSGIDLGATYQQQIKPGSTWPNPTLVTPATMNMGAYGNDISNIKQPLPPNIVGIN